MLIVGVGSLSVVGYVDNVVHTHYVVVGVVVKTNDDVVDGGSVEYTICAYITDITGVVVVDVVVVGVCVLVDIWRRLCLCCCCRVVCCRCYRYL